MKRPVPGQVFVWSLFLAGWVMACWSLFSIPQFLDDAFITFRAAENLADGRGASFNPGERVQTCTTPLYVLLLAGGRRVTGWHTDRFELAVEFVALSAILFLLWKLGRRLKFSRSWALLLPLFVLVQPSELQAVKGMEALAFTALILACLLAESRNRGALCGVLLGLVASTRTEGILVSLAYALYWLAGRLVYGPKSFRAADLARRAAWAVAVGLCFLLFVTTHYDSLIPNSVWAKRLQSAAGWQSVRSAWRDYLVGRPPWVSAWGLLLGVGVVATGVACFAPRPLTAAPPPGSVPAGRRGLLASPLAALRRNRHLYRTLGFLCAICILHGGFFVATRAPGGYSWYTFPEKVLMAPLYALSLAALWHARHGRHRSPTGGRAAWPRWAAGTVFAVLVAYLAATRLLFVAHGILTTHANGDLVANDKGYTRIGRWLAAEAPRGWSFAGAEIGILGYYSGLKCYDLAGIVTPASLSAFTREPLSQIVLRYRTEVYVTDFFEELVESSPRYDAQVARQFGETYALIDRRGHAWGETRVYCRRDAVQWIGTGGGSAEDVAH